MFDAEIINNYSSVLLELYKDHEEAAEESIRLYTRLKGDITMLNVLYNKLCCKKDKMHVLLNDETLHYTKGFFSLVIQNNRSEYLLPIIKSFCRKYEEYAHVGRVKLCVARVISEQNKQQLVNYLKNKFGFLRVCLDIILDRSLIGGFVVCVNENLYDCSIKKTLNKLSKKFNTNT